MLQASIGFFILGLVAWVVGAFGIAGISIEIGRVLLGVFLILSVLSFLFGSFRGRRKSTL